MSFLTWGGNLPRHLYFFTASFLKRTPSAARGGPVFAFNHVGQVFLYGLRPERMQERPQNFDGMGEDPESTLVAPRFDAEEARRAHPVVPLVETQGRGPYVNAGVWPRRGPRRSWPTALLAIVLLAAAAAGGALATKVLRRPQASAPAQTEAAPAQTDATTEAAPAQTESVPTHADGAAAQAQAEAAPAPSQSADAPRTEQASPAPQAPSEEARVKRHSRAPRESREREREAGMIAAPAEIPRRAAEDSDDRDEGHHGRGREKRRERGDDEAEKEIRKALKHSKGKAPRLVDVLTGP
jgi:hypothetical protein